MKTKHWSELPQKFRYRGVEIRLNRRSGLWFVDGDLRCPKFNQRCKLEQFIDKVYHSKSDTDFISQKEINRVLSVLTPEEWLRDRENKLSLDANFIKWKNRYKSDNIKALL